MKNWKFEVTTTGPHTLDFKIIDKHHMKDFYGEWEAHDNQELGYHLQGVNKCIRQGRYKKFDMTFNGEPMTSWNELMRRMYREMNH